MSTALRNVIAVRELGFRGSIIALVVAAADLASNTVNRWSSRRAAAANHREAGWS